MPLFWVSLAFLCGILLASRTSIPLLGWGMLAGLAFLVILPPAYRLVTTRIQDRLSRLSGSLRIPSPAIYPLMIIFLCLGAIRYQLSQPKIDPSHIAYYNDQTTQLVIDGIIMEPPNEHDTYTNLRIQVEQLRSAEETQFHVVKGLLLARVPASTQFNYGEQLQLVGELVTPPENEDFSYRDYLAHEGVYSYMTYPGTTLLQTGQGNPVMSMLYAFRQKALEVVYAIFPDPEASLLAGILLGVQAGITPELQEAFRLTGTSHILVISGFNITIIAGLFTYVFNRMLSRYKGALLSAMAVIFYALLVGANPAVLRAAFLGLLTLLGRQIGRQQSGVNSLAFGGAFLSVFNPTILWDVSFQLSFAATLGIVLYAEPFTAWFIRMASRIIPPERAERLAGPVSAYFLLTLAAQLTTLPLMIYYFKRLSLTALIANPLILPAQPALMVLGGISVLSGLFIQPVGQVFAWVTWPFAAYTIRMVEWLATIPHGSIALGQVAAATITLFYLVLFALTFARNQIKSMASKLTPAVALGVLAVATVLIWKEANFAPDGRLHVTVLDVGTGEGVLVQSPSGRAVLINGGASTNRLSSALGSRLSLFDRSIDWLVVADIDDEDLAGLPGNLERFPPANVLWSGNTSGTRSAANLWAAMNRLSISTESMQPAQAFDLGSGATLKALLVSDKGAVLLLEWRNFRMLLPMGVDADGLEYLQKESALRDISGLLLAESGYAPVNPDELLARLNPQVAILSVAAADRTGLPSPETIQALAGYNLLRTDQNGWIEITTDGSQMWVEVEKK